MAVVPPQRSNKEQRRLATEIAVVSAIAIFVIGVVGPIITAIIVGEIWG
jgi:hypothetical protein